MKIVKYQLFFRFQHQQDCHIWARSARTLALVISLFLLLKQVKFKKFLLFHKRVHIRHERHKIKYHLFRQDDQVEEQISLTQKPAEAKISSPEYQSSALLSHRSTKQQEYMKASSSSGLYHSVLVTVFCKCFCKVIRYTFQKYQRPTVPEIC